MKTCKYCKEKIHPEIFHFCSENPNISYNFRLHKKHRTKQNINEFLNFVLVFVLGIVFTLVVIGVFR